MGFERVARVDEIPSDRGLAVRIRGIAVGLFRVGEAVHAMEDRCPHAGVPLSQGRLRGPIVTCRAHAWGFDVRSGHRPEHADGFPIPCFAVRLEDGEVWVDLDAPINLGRAERPRG